MITNPDFFPEIPIGAALSALPSSHVTQQVSADLHAPYIIQSALTLERQLPRNTTLAVTYTNSYGLNILRSQDINAPLPGTYTGVQNSGVYPLGVSGAVFVMGIFWRLQPEPIHCECKFKNESDHFTLEFLRPE